MNEKFEIKAVDYHLINIALIAGSGVIMFSLIIMAYLKGLFIIDPLLIILTCYITILLTPYILIKLLSGVKTITVNENQILIDAKTKISWTSIKSIQFSRNLYFQYLKIKFDNKTFLLTSPRRSSHSKSFKRLADYLIEANINRTSIKNDIIEYSEYKKKANLKKFILIALAIVLISGFIVIAITLINRQRDIAYIITGLTGYIIISLLAFFRIYGILDKMNVLHP